MQDRPRARRSIHVVPLLVGVLVTTIACAQKMSVGLDDDEDVLVEAGGPQPFVPSQDAAVDAPPPELELCVGTECPWPYATCPSSTGNNDYICGVDLRSDSNNCGACGHVCPGASTFGVLNMTTRCVEGKCQRECSPAASGVPPIYVDFRDCNGDVNDGCEADAKNDLDNCGACGIVCPPGDHCVDGKCGCPTGMIYCGPPRTGAKACKDPSLDNDNCGGCGVKCKDPADAGTPPPNMAYGCVDAQCGELKCKNGWLDCDGVVDPNGCETNITDVNNCGGCGVKCAAGERCVVPTFGSPYCGCASGETFCNTPSAGQICADLTRDTKNCGACGYVCPGSVTAGNHGFPKCQQGFCDYQCEPGYADCDNNTGNGCETNLMVNTGNCGTCGHRCDASTGQPCIEGKCLMVECDAGIGEVTK